MAHNASLSLSQVHREDWFKDGRQSTKERFPLRADEVAPLLNGQLSAEELAKRLKERSECHWQCHVAVPRELHPRPAPVSKLALPCA